MRGEGAARKGINSLATHIAGLRKAEKQQQSVETLRVSSQISERISSDSTYDTEYS